MPVDRRLGHVVWYWGPAVAAMAAIFFASSLPTVPRIARDVSDLLLHFVAYAGLAVLVIRALASGRWDRLTHGSFWRAWLVAAAYGVSDEIHQWFVPGRFASVADWLADAAGAAVALAIVGALRRFSFSNRSQRNREV